MKLVFLSAFWTFMLDQATKWLVVHFLDLRFRGEIDVLPPLLNFRMAWNRGVNFGLFQGDSDMGRWILISIALAIVVFVVIWIWRDPPRKWGLISAGLLIGGALGNVIDRLLYGAVADFLNMSCCGIENPFAFNVADVAIFVGAVGLVLFPAPQKPGGKAGKKAP
ncbi:signal peptidase II [Primorskyibacter sedentarius]|uniref:Lipoprotein signal peptidase n=1 Tax=Primorskyibacter sedentarius TaxID=745311 RepID=A0A4R3J5E6_9RHOB|nr:signal peptidase II [Primorskyibacter sedentarius]TCS60502.1 signal peptidase II [Primorskyibacter sedentarius]